MCRFFTSWILHCWLGDFYHLVWMLSNVICRKLQKGRSERGCFIYCRSKYLIRRHPNPTRMVFYIWQWPDCSEIITFWMRVERESLLFLEICPNDYLSSIDRLMRIDSASCWMASLLILPRYKGEYNGSREFPRSILLFLLSRLLVGKVSATDPSWSPSQLCLTLPPRWLGSSMLGGEIKENWWEKLFLGVPLYQLVSELDS